MIIAKLTVGYDRGTARNDEKDLIAAAEAQAAGQKLLRRGAETPDGKVIRGIGSHFRSKDEQAAVKLRDQEASRVRNEFRKRFLVTALDGIFIVPATGVAREFIKTLDIRADVQVRVTEFILESPSGLDMVELGEWGDRIKKQLAGVSLGRTPQADEEGLKALETLSRCPVLKPSTGTRIRELVAMVRDQKINRIEIKRRLETMTVEIDGEPLKPRRAPVEA